jgi:hypothetical protein
MEVDLSLAKEALRSISAAVPTESSGSRAGVITVVNSNMMRAIRVVFG